MYKLDFEEQAKREFDKLAIEIKRRLQRKLGERLQHPRVEADRLAGMPDCYKIKLRSDGFRLVYRVEDDAVVVLVIAVGKRDGSKRDIYDVAAKRLRL